MTGKRLISKGGISILLYLIIFLPPTLIKSIRADAAVFQRHDAIEAGAAPAYGLIFSEYAKQYHHAPGVTLFARGFYRLNIEHSLFIYPGISWSYYHLTHKNEAGRRLLLFPFAFNLYFEAPVLTFPSAAGTFRLLPYMGLGAYLNHYESSRTRATGVDFGYQAGVLLTYRHEKMRNVFVELGINHLFTTNFKEYLPLLSFSLGAGDAFSFRDQSVVRDDAARENEILSDLDSADEAVIRSALGRAAEIQSGKIVRRCIELLQGDTRPAVRAAAAETLGRMKSSTSLPNLVQSMEHDPAKEVRHAAIRAIGMIGPNHNTVMQLRAIRDKTDDPIIIQTIDEIVRTAEQSR